MTCLHINYKAHMVCDLSIVVKMNEFSRSQAVTFKS